MHLVFLIHGVLGNPGHMRSMKESIKEAMGADYKQELVVYRARTLSPIASLEGVETNAYRLFVEIQELIKQLKVTHVSIVGYSLGGLWGRYLVGLLYEAGTFDSVVPVIFATFATPHLGSMNIRGNQTSKVINIVGSRAFGDTGLDLFGESSLLADMADPGKRYYQGLKRFRYLYLFANGFGDRTVNFWTSFLSPKDPFRRRSELDLRVYDSVPVLIDLPNSLRIEPTHTAQHQTSLKERVTAGAIKVVVPVSLLFIMGAVGTIALMSKIKQTLAPDGSSKAVLEHMKKRNKALDAVSSGLETTLDETLKLAGDGDDSEDSNEDPVKVREDELPKPAQEKGFKGLLDSYPVTLHVPPSTQAQMDALNELPWRKYALAFSRRYTHGDIVDRKSDSPEGKQLLNFFGKAVRRSHKAQYKRSSRL